MLEPEGAIAVESGLDAIEDNFTMGIAPLLPLVVVIILAVRKIPPTLAILTGALTGGLVAVTVQTDVVLGFVDDDTLAHPRRAAQGRLGRHGHRLRRRHRLRRQSTTCLTGGGMESCWSPIWLIITALGFGGIMNALGLLAKLIEPLRRRARSDRGVMAATGTTAIGINVLAADQYLALVLTGNVYKHEFEERGIAPQSCRGRSRTPPPSPPH